MTNDQILNETVRDRLDQWMRVNGWTATHVTRTMRAIGTSYIPGITNLERFLCGRSDMARDYLLDMSRFMDRFPSPGPYEPFHASLAMEIKRQAQQREDAIRDRQIANEERRANHVRQHLARERAGPQRKEKGVLYGLDKATIAALSGASL